MKWIGRFLVGLSCVASGLFPFFFWFDGDHLQNKQWPVHAKFHALWQTGITTLACAVGLFCVVALWERGSWARWVGAALPSCVWVAFLFAAFVLAPMYGLSDPFPHVNKTVLGLKANIWGTFAPLVCAVVGFGLDRLFNPIADDSSQ